MRPRMTAAALAAVLVHAPAAVAQVKVSWADFITTQPPVGVPTTVELGGGSTIDVTVATGGTQGLGGNDAGGVGAMETGLDYCRLRELTIFNGGGAGSVPTTLTFINFVPGPGHLRGFLMIGAVAGLSSPITVTSSVAGAVQGWAQVGSTFDLAPTNASPITWNPLAGTFVTNATTGNDSDGIVVDVGPLAAAGAITLSLSQHLNDGIVFSIGEEVACVPASAVPYGIGCPGTLGIPTLTSTPPRLGDVVTVTVGNSAGVPTPGLLFLGLVPAAIPGFWGCPLLVTPLVTLMLPVIPPQGLAIPAQLDCETALCGLSLRLQVLQADAGAPAGAASTPGLLLQFGS